ncbi:transposase family protein [Streptomyces sp. NPDC002262]|uniref:helix-turn-helix domain-containing protein n=1 Tax=unclassified Streptomyces TaxID=2593676 RepID=UPI003325C27D
MAGVVTASEPSWAAPSSRLSPRAFGKPVTVLRREGADAVRRGRPWSLPPEGRTLLVVAYWRTNLTRRQLAALLGVSKSAADRWERGQLPVPGALGAGSGSCRGWVSARWGRGRGCRRPWRVPGPGPRGGCAGPRRGGRSRRPRSGT